MAWRCFAAGWRNVVGTKEFALLLRLCSLPRQRAGMRTKWYCMLAALAFAMLAQAAEPQKTLRYILPAAETSLDPAVSRDLYTGHITQAIFDTLYTYDYLARPVKLAPAAAAALPEVSADGKTYTIRLKKGQLFTPDPA